MKAAFWVLKHLLLVVAAIALSVLPAFGSGTPEDTPIYQPPPADNPSKVFIPDEWDFYDCPLSLSPASPDSQSAEIDDTDFGIPLALKTKFPLDLIYPVTPMDLNIDTQCPTITLWGRERTLCAPSQIAAMAKNLFLLKFVLQSLLSL